MQLFDPYTSITLKAIDLEMTPCSRLPQQIFRRFAGFPSWSLIRGFIMGSAIILLFSLGSCASSNSAAYESQRRGLLMLEGEHIYKNKGFYHSKKSYKQRKKTMRAHKKRMRK
jgi:hypothetical protein